MKYFRIKTLMTIVTLVISLMVIDVSSKATNQESEVETRELKEENELMKASSNGKQQETRSSPLSSPTSESSLTSSSSSSSSIKSKLKSKLEGQNRDYYFTDNLPSNWNLLGQQNHPKQPALNKKNESLVLYLRGCPFFTGMCTQTCAKRGFLTGKCKGLLHLFCHCH